MKIIICDVGDAACAIVTSKNGYTMMIDCGSKSDRTNPIELFKNNKAWLGAKPYTTKSGKSYPLALLHITHPDEDHVRNCKRIQKELTPYLLKRTKSEKFPDADSIDNDYKTVLDTKYNGSKPEPINWNFQYNETFCIPIDTVVADETLNSKVRNNSSIIRYIKDDGVRILFCGDLETAGWDYILNHNKPFLNAISEGVDILIAPHHGHESGFPSALFDVIGNVGVVIHSKDTEASKEGTDVSSKYSSKANGVWYTPLNSKDDLYKGKVLTTRSNGSIYIETNPDGSYKVYTDTASSNHIKLDA